jgi:hypothetical protein
MRVDHDKALAGIETGNRDKVQEYGIKNPDMPLIQAVETLFGSGS